MLCKAAPEGGGFERKRRYNVEIEEPAVQSQDAAVLTRRRCSVYKQAKLV